ncbi:MAG: type II toxin-antitoxin system VapC family toxin [Acidobacteriia bacterium]|nr:type II toxin-antitoxin system VapC family toxin [Terriglobia bacterium]
MDSTALIALVTLEPGHRTVEEMLDRATISAVNLAETIHKLVQKGSTPRVTEALLRQLDLDVVDWSQDMAYRSAEFAVLGKSHGLSFGDRACLTLAKQLGATAVTADLAWRKVPSLSVPVLIFR